MVTELETRLPCAAKLAMRRPSHVSPRSVQAATKASPEMRRAVDGVLASWRAAIRPKALASHWLMAPLAAAELMLSVGGTLASGAPGSAAAGVTGAAFDATANLRGVGGPDGRKGPAQKGPGMMSNAHPIEQLVACATTRIVSEGGAVYGKTDPLSAAIVVSGNLVEQTDAVRPTCGIH